MRISDLFQHSTLYPILQEHCSSFIAESRRMPLLKNLPTQYSDCHKVKVRRQKAQAKITTPFNEAFDDQTHHIRQRSVFAKGQRSFIPEAASVEPFYVFPIDGYQFMYSKTVEDSFDAYTQVFESLIGQFGIEIGNKMLTEVLKFSYTNDKLAEGIASGSEIVLYNIPFYYAVRVLSTPSYDSLF